MSSAAAPAAIIATGVTDAGTAVYCLVRAERDEPVATCRVYVVADGWLLAEFPLQRGALLPAELDVAAPEGVLSLHLSQQVPC